jgi:hypothetical protein
LKPEDIFVIHPKIRWAGSMTREGKVLFARMREGLRSMTPSANDLSTLEIRTPYLIEASEQESRWVGALDRITFVFEKRVEMIVPLKDSYVAVTLEKDTLPEDLPKISKAIRELEHA